jgi:pimeloyl-ACP methyl ester carboxylesterase
MGRTPEAGHPGGHSAIGARGVPVPTLVFHGREDDVVHWSAAVDIAEAIPRAELQVHPGMGHLVPWELWPVLVAAIARTARHGEALAAR